MSSKAFSVVFRHMHRYNRDAPVMLRKLVAAFLLVLVVSPFTAPFQACPMTDGTSANCPQPNAAVVLAAPSAVDDAGSLIGPLPQGTGEQTLVPVAEIPHTGDSGFVLNGFPSHHSPAPVIERHPVPLVALRV